MQNQEKFKPILQYYVTFFQTETFVQEVKSFHRLLRLTTDMLLKLKKVNYPNFFLFWNIFNSEKLVEFSFKQCTICN